jgi:hypothetical protein
MRLALLMFDVVFLFFLFLVGVSCLVYYLPPAPPRTPSYLIVAPRTAEQEAAAASHHFHRHSPVEDV